MEIVALKAKVDYSEFTAFEQKITKLQNAEIKLKLTGTEKVTKNLAAIEKAQAQIEKANAQAISAEAKYAVQAEKTAQAAQKTAQAEAKLASEKEKTAQANARLSAQQEKTNTELQKQETILTRAAVAHERAATAAEQRHATALQKLGAQIDTVSRETATSVENMTRYIRGIDGMGDATVKASGAVQNAAGNFQIFKAEVQQADGSLQTYKYSVNIATGELYELDTGLKTAAQSTNDLNTQTNNLLSTFGKKLAVEAFADGIRKVKEELKEALQTMKDVDDKLVTVRKVSNATPEQIKGIEQRAYSTARKYGAAPEDYLGSVASFTRAGYKEQAEALAELSTKTQIVGDTTEEVANQFLLSVDAAYKYKGSVDELSKVLDGANEIDNKYATTIENIASGLGAVAPVASQVHVGVDELSAALGTITAVTQRSGTEAARALRALFLNIVGDTKTEVEDGLTWTVEEINTLKDVLKKYAPEAVKTAQATGKIIDPMKAIGGLAQSMKDGLLSEEDLMEMLSSLGGKLRTTQLTALVQNWDMYESMLTDYKNAAGSADAEVENAMDSWSKKTEQLDAKWVEFVSHMVDTKAIKGGIDVATNALDLLDTGIGRALTTAAALTAGVTLLKAAIAGLSASASGSAFLGVLLNPGTLPIAAIATAISLAGAAIDAATDSAEELEAELEANEQELNRISGLYSELEEKAENGTLTSREEVLLDIYKRQTEELEKQNQLIAKRLLQDKLGVGGSAVKGALDDLTGVRLNISEARRDYQEAQSDRDKEIYASAMKEYEETEKEIISELQGYYVAASDYIKQYGAENAEGVLALLQTIESAIGYSERVGTNTREYGYHLKNVDGTLVAVIDNQRKFNEAMGQGTEAAKKESKEASNLKKALANLQGQMSDTTTDSYSLTDAMFGLNGELTETAIEAMNANKGLYDMAIAEAQAEAAAASADFSNLQAQIIMVANSAMDAAWKLGEMVSIVNKLGGNLGEGIPDYMRHDLQEIADSTGRSYSDVAQEYLADTAKSYVTHRVNVANAKVERLTAYGNGAGYSGGGGGSSGGGGGGGGGSVEKEYTRREVLESELNLLQKQGAASDAQVSKMREIQDELKNEEEALRASNGQEVEINELSAEWWDWQNKINDLLEEGKEKTEDITSEYESQNKALEDQAALQEKLLAVEEAREALENAKKQRTVRIYNSATGQWEWVADARAVEQAEERLKGAQDALNGESGDGSGGASGGIGGSSGGYRSGGTDATKLGTAYYASASKAGVGSVWTDENGTVYETVKGDPMWSQFAGGSDLLALVKAGAFYHEPTTWYDSLDKTGKLAFNLMAGTRFNESQIAGLNGKELIQYISDFAEEAKTGIDDYTDLAKELLEKQEKRNKSVNGTAGFGNQGEMLSAGGTLDLSMLEKYEDELKAAGVSLNEAIRITADGTVTYSQAVLDLVEKYGREGVIDNHANGIIGLQDFSGNYDLASVTGLQELGFDPETGRWAYNGYIFHTVDELVQQIVDLDNEVAAARGAGMYGKAYSLAAHRGALMHHVFENGMNQGSGYTDADNGMIFFNGKLLTQKQFKLEDKYSTNTTMWDLPTIVKTLEMLDKSSVDHWNPETMSYDTATAGDLWFEQYKQGLRDQLRIAKDQGLRPSAINMDGTVNSWAFYNARGYDLNGMERIYDPDKDYALALQRATNEEDFYELLGLYEASTSEKQRGKFLKDGEIAPQQFTEKQVKAMLEANKARWEQEKTQKQTNEEEIKALREQLEALEDQNAALDDKLAKIREINDAYDKQLSFLKDIGAEQEEINELAEEQAEFEEEYADELSTDVVKVQANGKAAAGLKVGTQVVTGGGTYRITGVNEDGTYQSELVDKDKTTYNTDDSEYTTYDSGGILAGLGGIKATMRDEMVLPPDITAKMLSPSSDSRFRQKMSELSYLYGDGINVRGFGGTVDNRIGTQNNGDTYQYGDIRLSEAEARTTTLYELAQRSRSLSLVNARH